MIRNPLMDGRLAPSTAGPGTKAGKAPAIIAPFAGLNAVAPTWNGWLTRCGTSAGTLGGRGC